MRNVKEVMSSHLSSEGLTISVNEGQLREERTEVW